jgi:hypothetical protein
VRANERMSEEVKIVNHLFTSPPLHLFRIGR